MKRKHDETLSTAALRVLVLGDGNLSYSLGLAERLSNAQLLATSYDDSEEVFTKYTESHATVARLEALGPRVRVLHGVDALDIQESLRRAQQREVKKRPARVAQEEPADEAPSAAPTTKTSERTEALAVFDHVVFNHPHTGWEDMHRHTSLLAHFLESCKSVLAPASKEEGQEGGQAHVTLAGDQCKRWKLFETADRLGFELRHICDFYRQFGPNPLPAQIKRHQSGKSFRLRGLPSFTYTFTLKSAGDDTKFGTPLLASPSSSPPILWKHSYDAAEHEAVMTIRPAGDGTVAPSTKDAPITDVVKSVKCNMCGKCFRGPKDLRKHMIDAHEKEDTYEAEDLACKPCARTFKDKTALEQHQRAKHSGMFQNLKPDWSAAGAVSTNEDEGKKAAPVTGALSLHFKGVERATYEARTTEAAAAEKREELVLCTVCDYYVTAPGSAAEHLADLRPPERPTCVCRGCDRTFREERALKQHANACWPSEETGAVGSGAETTES